MSDDHDALPLAMHLTRRGHARRAPSSTPPSIRLEIVTATRRSRYRGWCLVWTRWGAGGLRAIPSPARLATIRDWPRCSPDDRERGPPDRAALRATPG